jgi:hypothetical protein
MIDSLKSYWQLITFTKVLQNKEFLHDIFGYIVANLTHVHLHSIYSQTYELQIHVHMLKNY